MTISIHTFQGGEKSKKNKNKNGMEFYSITSYFRKKLASSNFISFIFIFFFINQNIAQGMVRSGMTLPFHPTPFSLPPI